MQPNNSNSESVIFCKLSFTYEKCIQQMVITNIYTRTHLKLIFNLHLIVELGVELYDFGKVNRLVKVVSRKLNYRSLSKVCFKHKARILLKGR